MFATTPLHTQSHICKGEALHQADVTQQLFLGLEVMRLQDHMGSLGCDAMNGV